MSEVQRRRTTILRKEGTGHQKVEGNENGRTIRIKADINERIGIRLYSCMHLFTESSIPMIKLVYQVFGFIDARKLTLVYVFDRIKKVNMGSF